MYVGVDEDSAPPRCMVDPPAGRVRMRLVEEYDASPAAIRPLMATYWTSSGWRIPRKVPSRDDFDRAVAAGVMFRQDRTLHHDQWVAEVRDVARDLKPDDVGAAFLTSLTSRRLDLRSALGSLAVARWLPDHEYTADGAGYCSVCGTRQEATADLNVMSFERFKWGGVQRADLPYLSFDLTMFERAPRLSLDDDAVGLGRMLLRSIGDVPPEYTAVRLAPTLTFIKGNKAERLVMLEVLGVAGVLQDPSHPGYRTAFVDYADRESTAAHYEDQSYPLPWWRAQHGFDAAAVDEWFSGLLV